MRFSIVAPSIRLVRRLNDLTTSRENSCVTVNSREGGRVNVFRERSLNDVFTRRLILCYVNMKRSLTYSLRRVTSKGLIPLH